MTASHWHRSIDSEETRVSGGEISELIEMASAYVSDEGATWRIEDGAVMFSRPMGETCVGRDGP